MAFLLLEDSFHILQEDGASILLDLLKVILPKIGLEKRFPAGEVVENRVLERKDILSILGLT